MVPQPVRFWVFSDKLHKKTKLLNINFSIFQACCFITKRWTFVQYSTYQNQASYIPNGIKVRVPTQNASRQLQGLFGKNSVPKLFITSVKLQLSPFADRIPGFHLFTLDWHWLTRPLYSWILAASSFLRASIISAESASRFRPCYVPC